jgi:hypothetical protein
MLIEYSVWTGMKRIGLHGINEEDLLEDLPIASHTYLTWISYRRTRQCETFPSQVETG